MNNSHVVEGNTQIVEESTVVVDNGHVVVEMSHEFEKIDVLEFVDFDCRANMAVADSNIVEEHSHVVALESLVVGENSHFVDMAVMQEQSQNKLVENDYQENFDL